MSNFRQFECELPDGSRFELHVGACRDIPGMGKCDRCWQYKPGVNPDPEWAHVDGLCERCKRVISCMWYDIEHGKVRP